MDERGPVEVELAPQQDQRHHLRVWAHSIRGKVRPENQDAWCLAAPQGVWSGPTGPDTPAPGIEAGRVVMGVFDGLGGHANGREAAQAAARALPDAAVQGWRVDQVVSFLEDAVGPTGGMTTALVAVVEEGVDHVRVVSVGDSAAFRKGTGGGLRRVNELDRSGRHKLTACLGLPEGAGARRGHEGRVPLREGLVLTTDGVADELPFERDWGGLLADPPTRVGQRFHDLFDAVWRRGAPDNATTILVRPSRVL